MNLVTTLGLSVPIVLLLPFLAVASTTDVLRRHISNVLIVCMVGCGTVAQAAFFGATGLSSALGGLVVGVGLLLPFYALGGMGAGDVKLLGAAGTFLGPYGALLAGVFTLAAGGALALGVLAWRSAARLLHARTPRGRFARALGVPSLELPYSLAIAVGALGAAYYSSVIETWAPAW
jgi:prepilin peptidase CpaA